jgi:hypothetical protein
MNCNCRHNSSTADSSFYAEITTDIRVFIFVSLPENLFENLDSIRNETKSFGRFPFISPIADLLRKTGDTFHKRESYLADISHDTSKNLALGSLFDNAGYHRVAWPAGSGIAGR